MGPSLNAYLEGVVPQVRVNEVLRLEGSLIDVRTAEEFSDGCIPGALNHPLFDRLERSLIGTLYRQVGHEAALERGKSLVAPQLERFLDFLRPLRSQSLTIYCARGSLRSGSVTRLLREDGFRVRQLEGGYKSYRQYVLKQLQNFHSPLIVLHGQTGVGKTLLIQRLPDSLDLEALAQHRSSVFGAINRQPRTQKNFENLMHLQIYKLPRKLFLYIEGESRKVGRVFIPAAIADAMKKGKKVLLKASLETRIQRILAEYKLKDEKILSEVNSILQTLQERLGKKTVSHLSSCLFKGEMEEFTRILLEKYYDPRYQHGMREYHYDLELNAEDLELTLKELLEFRSEQNIFD